MIKIISSMATKGVLEALLRTYAESAPLSYEAAGGVDVAKRVRHGEMFGLVVLAQETLKQLKAEGFLSAQSIRSWLRSTVSIALKSSVAWRPTIDDENAVKQLLLAAKRIGYSTGPSGDALLKLLQRWGIFDKVESKLVRADAGTPVAQLIADGKVTLGLQQKSELLHVAGVDILADLPDTCAIETVFATSTTAMLGENESQTIAAFLDFMHSKIAEDMAIHYGMQLMR